MKFYNYNKNYNLLLLIVLIVLFTNINSTAQLNMPFSNLGFGDDLQNDNISNRTMGGVSIADYNYYNINVKNPASYGITRNLETRRILFDIGLDWKNQNLMNSNSSTSNTYTNISYLYLGIPIYKKIGMVLGFQPLNLVSYNLASVVTNRLLDTGKVFVNSFGKGSGYQFFVGLGYNYKKFSYGVNIGYVFGNKSTENYITPLTNPTALEIGTKKNLIYNGLMVQYGVLFNHTLNKSENYLDLQIGINGTLPISLNNNLSNITGNFVTNSSGVKYILDTINIKQYGGTINNPLSLGFGIMLNKFNQWKIGLDYNFKQYSSLNLSDQNYKLLDQSTINCGIEFIPNIRSITSYFAQIPYRLGFNIGNYYTKDIDKTIYPFGVSFGMGFYVKKLFYSLQSTFINVGFEYKQKGFVNNSFYENYYNIYIGFSLSDLWFRTSKFY